MNGSPESPMSEDVPIANPIILTDPKREKRLEYKRNYRLKNRDKIKEYSKKYYSINKEIVDKKCKEYHNKNKESLRSILKIII